MSPPPTSIAALNPEVVLLGTGERQVFPPREAIVALLKRRIGVEVMDNAAASRTYNLLASEGRRAVAAFMLPRALTLMSPLPLAGEG